MTVNSLEESSADILTIQPHAAPLPADFAHRRATQTAVRHEVSGEPWFGVFYGLGGKIWWQRGVAGIAVFAIPATRAGAGCGCQP